MGCDYYVSVADKKAKFDDSEKDTFKNNQTVPKATFTVNANPKRGNGRLPETLIKWCEGLRDDGEKDKFKMLVIKKENRQDKKEEEQKPFVKETKDMVVFGGLKTPHLFVTSKGKSVDIKGALTKKIVSLMGERIETIDSQDRIRRLHNIASLWSDTTARDIMNALLSSMKEKMQRREVDENINEVESIGQGRREQNGEYRN